MKISFATISFACCCLFWAAPHAVLAETYQFPEKNPAFEVPIAEHWAFEKDETGFTASPDDDAAVQLVYYATRGEQAGTAVAAIADSMNEYIDSNWKNITPEGDKTLKAGGVEYKIYFSSADLKTDEGSDGTPQRDSLQAWVYSPAPGYTAFAVLSIAKTQENIDKYAEEFAYMLTGTKSVK